MTLKQGQMYPSSSGFMTLRAKKDYIDREIKLGNMPRGSHKVPTIVSLDASSDTDDPLYFWQLYSVIGPEPIHQIVERFYARVFDDKAKSTMWFRQAFINTAPQHYHVMVQAEMWTDCFGGGHQYHGGLGRLHFHHQHNAKEVMTQLGAEQWMAYMIEVLDEQNDALKSYDPRVRGAINSFLEYFITKYASDFKFNMELSFGSEYTTPISLKRYKTEDELEKLPTSTLKLGLLAEEINVSDDMKRNDLIEIAMESK